ncbi:MAG: hypothetical protein IT427_01110 [Pirellulales bacterium]|nr:hypothetical protein [Pirellulales bacterium]
MRSRVWLLLWFVSTLSGCQTADFGYPSWCNPPSASHQLAQTRQFDPFPDPTIGTPILGGRPQGFMEPRPEPNPVKHQFVPGVPPSPYATAY